MPAQLAFVRQKVTDRESQATKEIVFSRYRSSVNFRILEADVLSVMRSFRQKPGRRDRPAPREWESNLIAFSGFGPDGRRPINGP